MNMIEASVTSSLGNDNVFHETPLHLAVKSGNLQGVKILLENKANIHAKDKLDLTSLHLAAFSADANICALLLENGANLKSIEISGKTPLHFAIEGKNLNTLEFLIECGADLEAGDLEGRTPLHTSVIQHEFNALKFLLEEGANIDAKDIYGNTPLHLAAFYNQISMIQTLAKNMANVDLPNSDGFSPLLVAITEKNYQAAKKLLECGANPDFAISTGSTALHFACFQGSLNMVELLIKFKANINAQNDKGETPLFQALSDFNLGISYLLLSHGANSEVVSVDGISAKTIMQSSESFILRNLSDITSLDLEHFRNNLNFLLSQNTIEVKNFKIFSPIHVALMLKDESLFDRLCELKVNPNFYGHIDFSVLNDFLNLIRNSKHLVAKFINYYNIFPYSYPSIQIRIPSVNTVNNGVAYDVHTSNPSAVAKAIGVFYTSTKIEFSDNEHLFYASNKEDLHRLIEDLLSHEEEPKAKSSLNLLLENAHLSGIFINNISALTSVIIGQKNLLYVDHKNLPARDKLKLWLQKSLVESADAYDSFNSMSCVLGIYDRVMMSGLLGLWPLFDVLYMPVMFFRISSDSTPVPICSFLSSDSAIDWIANQMINQNRNLLTVVKTSPDFYDDLEDHATSLQRICTHFVISHWLTKFNEELNKALPVILPSRQKILLDCFCEIMSSKETQLKSYTQEVLNMPEFYENNIKTSFADKLEKRIRELAK
jgi:ankyrin repeat protein